jgi:uncharacterized membrane protein YeaQ/YmgE (transglycosylase-associated protein family)
MSLAAISVPGVQWGWVLVVGVGLFTGLAAHASKDGPARSNRVGCLGISAVGVAGALAGELILGRLFDVGSDDVVGVMLTAFIGASTLVILFSNWPHRRQPEPEDR